MDAVAKRSWTWVAVLVALALIVLLLVWTQHEGLTWTEVRHTAGITYTLDGGELVTVESNEQVTMVAERGRFTAPSFAVRGSGEVKTLTVDYDVGTKAATAHLPLQGGTYVDGSLVVEGTGAQVLGIVSGRLDVRLSGMDPPGTVTVRYDVIW